jgi:signal transduction histidine kinase
MSHELRTPLNAIIGYSELLQEEAEERGQTDLVADLEKIHLAGGQLLTLVSGILDLSKIEAGKMELQLETFDLAALIAGVVTTTEPLVAKNGNVLRVEGPDDPGLMHADPDKVRQILLNLLSNAAKFTRQGTITLAVARELTDGTDWVCFRVTDTGIGMTPTQMETLFQPFTQADGTIAHRYGGTGLGLALSARFCWMMGGAIGVESEVGKGSTFTVRLPAQVSEQQGERVEGSPADPLTVLPG